MTDRPQGHPRPDVGSAAAIRTELAQLADPERAAGMAGYFQARPGGYGEGDRFLGIAVPPQRRIARRHAAATPLGEVEELLGSLPADGGQGAGGGGVRRLPAGVGGPGPG